MICAADVECNPMEMCPAEDLSRWTFGEWVHPLEKGVRAVSHDTRKLPSDSLYVALKGDNFDGHNFIDEAFEKGALAALVNRDAPLDYRPDRSYLLVDDTRLALQAISSGYRKSLMMECVAITGSVGKTTVKEMIADILQQESVTARTHGNWNNDIGVPLSLLAAPRDAEYGVFEIGMNSPGELQVLCDLVAPKWAVMTPVGMAHLAKFDSVREIAEEKSVLPSNIPAHGEVVLSIDDPWSELFRSRIKGHTVTVSFQRDADYRGLEQSKPGSLMVAEKDGQVHSYPLPVEGAFIRQDAILAIAFCRQRGISPAVIASVLSEFSPPGMRWKRDRREGVLFVNDAYNANPMSMSAAVSAFRDEQVEGKRWMVLGGMHELGRAEHEEHLKLGESAAKEPLAGLVCVGELGKLIYEAARESSDGPLEICHQSDAASAAKWLKARVSPGDAVLLKASRGEKLEDILEVWSR